MLGRSVKRAINVLNRVNSKNEKVVFDNMLCIVSTPNVKSANIVFLESEIKLPKSCQSEILHPLSAESFCNSISSFRFRQLTKTLE